MNDAFSSGEARHRAEPDWRCDECHEPIAYWARVCDPCLDADHEDRDG